MVPVGKQQEYCPSEAKVETCTVTDAIQEDLLIRRSRSRSQSSVKFFAMRLEILLARAPG